jgi:hypothetical protein
VGEIAPVVGQLDPCSRVLHGFVLAAMYMNMGVREIWKAARMIEVEVRHDNVADILGRVPEAFYLADGRAVRGLVAAEVQPK